MLSCIDHDDQTTSLPEIVSILSNVNCDVKCWMDKFKAVEKLEKMPSQDSSLTSRHVISNKYVPLSNSSITNCYFIMSAGPPAVDTHQWHESVLSTRSLSYVSMAGDSPLTPTRAGFSIPPTRKSTLASIDDYSDSEILAMTQTIQAPPPLPPSVANSPLFRLPLELREHIYLHLLHSALGFNFPSDHSSTACTPSILRVCRAMHAEATPLLYTTNKLIFSHPSDANMFRRALASELSTYLSTIVLRVKNTDTKLWTHYFNTHAAERSLVRDYPHLRTLFVRFRGPRFQPLFSAEQNAVHWLRDPKLHELIPSVRKCVPDVRIGICVRVPEEWDMKAWDKAVERTVRDGVQQQSAHGGGGGAAPWGFVPRPVGEGQRAGEETGQEEASVDVYRGKNGYAWIWGVWIKLETEGT